MKPRDVVRHLAKKNTYKVMIRKITIILLLLTMNLINCQELTYKGPKVLNVREGAGTEFKIITKVSEKEKVKIISDQGEYVEVETENGIKGFVLSNLLLSSRAVNNNNNNEENNYSFLKIIVFGFLIVISYKIRNLLKLKY